MENSAMQTAFEARFGAQWGNPENARDEQVWAAAWNTLRAQAITGIEKDVLPTMGRQNRGVKLCLTTLRDL